MPKSAKSNSTARKASPSRTTKGISKRTFRDIVPSNKSICRREGAKIATVIPLLGRKGGATIAGLAAATGWRAHSVRGAIKQFAQEETRPQRDPRDN